MHVLLIDDHPDAARMALHAVGAHVDAAGTAREALLILAALRDPALVVVLDLMLPGVEEFGGPLAFAHEVRRVHWGLVVVSSGCDPRMVFEVADEIGAVALTKPHLSAELLAACGAPR